jgi:hypothetical protein
MRAVLPAMRAFEKITLELSEPPEGVTLRDVSVGGNEAEFVIDADRSKAAPGLRGNLIVVVSGERVPPQRAGQAAAPGPAARRRIPIGTLPAIPFEIIPPR